ncbi:MAG: glycosyltransferase family 2 protein [Deltaproteobacteria bacterium]|nr:glycosyltransferase family 2 protein [Deltaproteobacteria bacterium]MBI3391301.1 glycosyltransferase family 2 protein [Deltaproteobacteria bacterium]
MIVSGFYGHLVASVGVSGVRLSAKVAIVTLTAFALGVAPAVTLGGLNGLFALYTVINIAVAIFYHRALHRLSTDSSVHPSRPPIGGESVCAVVVAYYPDSDFEARLRSLLPQVGAVVVVDNTPNGGSAERLGAMGDHIAVVENSANLGVAAALNIGLRHAQRAGCPWLLTLDQDTRCYPDMVHTLLHVLATCEPAPAVIGGNYLDPRRGATEVPEADGDWVEQITVITSGCLIDVARAQAIGGFREDYFIDQVDHEFCLRVRRHGGRVVISRKPVMTHSVGGPAGAHVPLLGIFPNHAPLRKYYITRNSLVTIAGYWKQEPGWCARRLARLLLGLGLMALLEENPLAKVRAFAAGTVDGVRQRMGPCRRENLHD